MVMLFGVKPRNISDSKNTWLFNLLIIRLHIKHAKTITQPYPPSGGFGSISKEFGSNDGSLEDFSSVSTFSSATFGSLIIS